MSRLLQASNYQLQIINSSENARELVESDTNHSLDFLGDNLVDQHRKDYQDAHLCPFSLVPYIYPQWIKPLIAKLFFTCVTWMILLFW
jgi:hypothetical protein